MIATARPSRFGRANRRQTPVSAPKTLGSLPPLAGRLVAVIAAVKVAFHLATATLWGFHRDEFYYLAGGRHLDWGFVDHPPITPLLYRIGETLFGDSLFGLHVIPALFGGAFVVMAAVLTREVGGGRAAQGMAMLVAAIAPVFLTTSHFISTVTFDLVAWAAATWLVMRIVRTGEVRLWPAVGGVVGLGLLNKHTMAFWVIGVGAGLLLTPQRRLLANRWLLAGGALALALFAPNLVWQAQHHWASLEFSRNLRQRLLGENMSQFIPLQLGIMTPVGTALWFVALRRILARDRNRASAWADYRWLGMAYVVLFVVMFASGGKAYYLGSIYLPLVAVGAVAIERTWNSRSRRVLTAAIAITGALAAPLFTPMLPTSALSAVPVHKVNDDMSGMLGWHTAAREVAAVYHSLPAAEQSSAVILTQTYSQASAIDYWHRELAVPNAISPHNSYWWWGYHDARPDATVVAVGFSPLQLDRFFRGCSTVARMHAAHDLMDTDTIGAPIAVCHADRPWSAIWPDLKLYA